MRTYSISQFKAQALSLLNGIAETGESIIVTKRGRPLVTVVPYQKPERECRPGKLKGTLLVERDILSPMKIPVKGSGE